jgi:signal transduction histidine kinase
LELQELPNRSTIAVLMFLRTIEGTYLSAAGGAMQARRESIHDTLSGFLAALEGEITQRWLEAVAESDELRHSQRLTRRELIDHLPQLYRALCAWVTRGSTHALHVGADENARLHGTYRWREGYQLDELLRELDILRGIVVCEAVTRFARGTVAHADARFNEEVEITVRCRIDQFFREVSIASVKEYMAQHDAAIAHYTATMQESNRALQRAASQRQRLTTVLAHELRNFVQALSAMTDLWERQPSNADVRELAKNQIRDMHSLLQQLLEHSSLIDQHQPLQIETFKPEALCNELAIAYRAAAEAKHLHLFSDCTDAPETVQGDRLKTKQIIANLLSNAINYTDRGQIYLSASRAINELWQIHIVDTGPGMPTSAGEGVLSGLGNMDDLLPGRGIGLGITKDLVDMLGGEIDMHSARGEGTRFTVTLPIAPLPQTAAI